jgi:hypothetical protein
MSIPFKCPACGGKAIVELTSDEEQDIKNRILEDGRSPTLIVRCENDHELLVTLFNLRSGEGLGVRDVIVPHRSDSGSENGNESEPDETDWLAKAFGGDE